MFRPDEGDRADVPNYMVIITDGKSDNPQHTWEQAIQARSEGINILSVGVGEVHRTFQYILTHRNIILCLSKLIRSLLFSSICMNINV